MKKKYDVFGTPVKVKKLDLREQQVAGVYDQRRKEILLDKYLEQDEMIQTFLHEVIHAIWDNTGMNQTYASLDVQELICENVSKWLVKNFKMIDK